jgi:uncharacterized protein YkwD
MMNHTLIALGIIAFGVILAIFSKVKKIKKEHYYAQDEVVVITADGMTSMAMLPFKGLPKLATPFLPQSQQQRWKQQQQQQQLLEKQSFVLPHPTQQIPEIRFPIRTFKPKQTHTTPQTPEMRFPIMTFKPKQINRHSQPDPIKPKQIINHSKPDPIKPKQINSHSKSDPIKPKQINSHSKSDPIKPKQTTTSKETSTTTTEGNMEIKRTTPEYRAAMLDELNNVRQCYNLQPLQLHDTLNKSAQAMADQIAQKSFNPNAASPHDDYDNKTPDDRAKAAGWKYDTWVGENISYNPFGLQPGQKQEDVDDWVWSNPRASIDGWLCSKGHRDALLDPFRTHVGIAYASGTLPNLRSLCVTPLGTVPNTPTSQYSNPKSDCNFQCKDAPNH